VDEIGITLSAKRLTTGYLCAPGRALAADRLTITDKMIEGMAEPQNRQLAPVYPVIFIDAIHIKIRDGQVANRQIYVALAVTCEGLCDILGLWAGDVGEGAKYWLHVLTELKNRGVADVLIVVCDGLTGLPDAITTVGPQTIRQTYVTHLLRNRFRARPSALDAIAKALMPVYTAPTEAAARASGSLELTEAWSARYPAVVRLLGQRLGRIRAVARLRLGDPPGDLLDQRHRRRQRPHPPHREAPRALPRSRLHSSASTWPSWA
jgi:transposase-like protein